MLSDNNLDSAGAIGVCGKRKGWKEHRGIYDTSKKPGARSLG
jgi:hypothetical protein